MASEGVPAVLALEIEVSRAPASARGAAAADRRAGSCEPDLGQGTDRRGALAEAGHSGLAAYSQALHVARCWWGRARSQTWRTFIQNHARAVLACAFFVAATVRFQLVYVFVVLEVESRRIIYSFLRRSRPPSGPADRCEWRRQVTHHTDF